MTLSMSAMSRAPLADPLLNMHRFHIVAMEYAAVVDERDTQYEKLRRTALAYSRSHTCPFGLGLGKMGSTVLKVADPPPSDW